VSCGIYWVWTGWRARFQLSVLTLSKWPDQARVKVTEHPLGLDEVFWRQERKGRMASWIDNGWVSRGAGVSGHCGNRGGVIDVGVMKRQRLLTLMADLTFHLYYCKTPFPVTLHCQRP
jgi:hypothetical protein